MLVKILTLILELLIMLKSYFLILIDLKSSLFFNFNFNFIIIFLEDNYNLRISKCNNHLIFFFISSYREK